MLSLMWGTGWPALYSHENLADVTHRRGGDLYGATSMNYYRHVYKMLRAGSRPVKYEMGKPELRRAARRLLRVRARDRDAGAAHDRRRQQGLRATRTSSATSACARSGCDQHELKIYPGYGHQDVFMGKDVARDCFPAMLDFIRRHSEPAPDAGSGAVGSRLIKTETVINAPAERVWAEMTDFASFP